MENRTRTIRRVCRAQTVGDPLPRFRRRSSWRRPCGEIAIPPLIGPAIVRRKRKCDPFLRDGNMDLAMESNMFDFAAQIARAPQS
jgi:hypothetical protein